MKANRNLRPGKTYFAAIRQRTRNTGFFDDDCREFYLRRLLVCQNAFKVQLHAYLLMQQEIFLVFTPLTPTGFASYLKFLNRSYSNYYSIRFARNVATWQNAPLLCQLPGDKLVFDCQKFVERYVIDIGSQNHPGEYRYSSYCANAFSHRPGKLSRHRVVRSFINSDAGGLQRYRDFIAAPFRSEYLCFLRSRLLSGAPLLHRKALLRLEYTGALTDIEKSVTMSVVLG